MASRAVTCWGWSSISTTSSDLGVTAIYLNPIFASASNHRYHTYDYSAVDPLLGGDAALRELLDAAHGRGMRVVLDGVFNHASRGFWPFHHVMENGARLALRGLVPLRPRLRSKAGRQLRAYREHAHPADDRRPRRVQEHAPGTASLEASATAPGGTCRPCPS